MTIFLIAPNVSEQLGGEAIKALQIFQELKKIYPGIIQITHERNEIEIVERLECENVLFVRDDAASIFFWKSLVFRSFLDIWFSRNTESNMAIFYKIQKI